MRRLGDASDSDQGDDSALSWMKRLEKKARKQKEIVNEKVADNQNEKHFNETQPDLTGIRVAHDFSTLGTDSTSILVLEDANVLDQDKQDTLVDLPLAEQDRIKEHLKRKREKGASRHLEEEPARKGFVIGDPDLNQDIPMQLPVEQEQIASPVLANEFSEFKKKKRRVRAVVANDDSADDLLPPIQALPPKPSMDQILAKARIAAIQKRVLTAEEVAEAVIQDNQEMEQDEPEGMIISETTEFIDQLRLQMQLKQQEHEKSFQVDKEENKMDVELENIEMVSSETHSDSSNEDGNIIQEPLVQQGLAATLALLQQQGVLNKNANSSSTNKEKSARLKNQKSFQDYKPDIQLEYYDQFGRALNPKEAYKELSYRFHGKRPGKNKTEKMLKKIVEERKLQERESSAANDARALALRQRQQLEGSAHVVLGVGAGGAVQAALPSLASSKKEKKAFKKTKKNLEASQRTLQRPTEEATTPMIEQRIVSALPLPPVAATASGLVHSENRGKIQFGLGKLNK